jgi:multiple RNA-binding domain-containing protein 1
MQPPSKQKAWANDEAQMDVQSTPAVETTEDITIPEGESDDEYQVLTKKPKTATQEPSSIVEPTVHREPPTQDVDVAKTQAHDTEELPDAPVEEATGPVSDADWLRSRTNRILDLVEDDDVAPPPKADRRAENAVEEPVAVNVEQPEAAVVEAGQSDDAEPQEEDKVRQTGRLFLRNLHFDVTEEDLREQFAKYGSLEEVGKLLFSFFFRLRDEYPDRDN